MLTTNKFLLAAAAAALTTAGLFFLLRSKNEIKIPHIVELWIYPIAGCRGYKVQSSKMLEGGLEFDREFSVIVPSSLDENNKPTANSWKKLVTIPIQQQIFTEVVVVSDVKFLKIEYRPIYKSVDKSKIPPPLLVPLVTQQTNTKENAEISIERYGFSGTGLDVGDEAASWFQTVFRLGIAENTELSDNDRESFDNNNLAHARLARAATLRRPIQKPLFEGSGATQQDTIRFQYFSDLHIMTTESFEWLQKNLPPDTYEADVGFSQRAMLINAERFRVNVVVAGCEFPHEELWKKIQIGDRMYRFAKHTDRCEIPTMDLLTGRRHPALQPTNTLKKIRGAKYPFQHERYEKCGIL